jgi:hypothetical protein
MSGEYIYCFIRKDLSPVQQIIQLAHATFEVGTIDKTTGQPPNIVLFEVENEIKLLEAHNWINKHKIQCILFDEPDLEGQFTAIATTPVSTKQERQVFEKFNLYK